MGEVYRAGDTETNRDPRFIQRALELSHTLTEDS